jgi:hypothetical protein
MPAPSPTSPGSPAEGDIGQARGEFEEAARRRSQSSGGGDADSSQRESGDGNESAESQQQSAARQGTDGAGSDAAAGSTATGAAGAEAAGTDASSAGGEHRNDGNPGDERTWGGAGGANDRTATAGAGSGRSPGGPDGTAGTRDGGNGEELEQVLRDLDGAILAEREFILARTNAQAGSRPMPRGEGAPGGAAGASGDGEGGSPADEAGRSPEVRDAPPPPRTAGVGTNTRDSRVPDDIPDASGDDVFARQLREAAMNEPDPELREKLWDEYRRYRART